jgi:hypothetical protein
MSEPRLKAIGAVLSGAMVVVLGGCGMVQKSIGTYKEMKVQTKTSEALFVDPVPREKRTVYLDVKSGVDSFDRRAFRGFVVKQFATNDNGYQIIDDPDVAQFTMTVYVLNLEETTAEKAAETLTETTATRDRRGRGQTVKTTEKPQASFAELITGKSTTDKKVIALICDVQIRERAAEGVMVRKDSQVDAKISGVGSARQTVSEVSDRKEYRARILTTAEGVNFELAEVQGEMFQKTASAMSGFF